MNCLILCEFPVFIPLLRSHIAGCSGIFAGRVLLSDNLQMCQVHVPDTIILMPFRLWKRFFPQGSAKALLFVRVGHDVPPASTQSQGLLDRRGNLPGNRSGGGLSRFYSLPTLALLHRWKGEKIGRPDPVHQWGERMSCRSGPPSARGNGLPAGEPERGTYSAFPAGKAV